MNFNPLANSRTFLAPSSEILGGLAHSSEISRALDPLAPMFLRPWNLLFLNTSKFKFLLNILHLMPLNRIMVSYISLILPLFDYGDKILAYLNYSTLMEHFEILQNKTAKIVFGLPPRSSATEALKRLNIRHLYWIDDFFIASTLCTSGLIITPSTPPPQWASPMYIIPCAKFWIN